MPTDLKVAECFILTVHSSIEKGTSWIADRLLKVVKERKFSGTQKAGFNSDLMGKTCDAFAHFSMMDSANSFVLADIQGIQD